MPVCLAEHAPDDFLKPKNFLKLGVRLHPGPCGTGEDHDALSGHLGCGRKILPVPLPLYVFGAASRSRRIRRFKRLPRSIPETQKSAPMLLFTASRSCG